MSGQRPRAGGRGAPRAAWGSDPSDRRRFPFYDHCPWFRRFSDCWKL